LIYAVCSGDAVGAFAGQKDDPPKIYVGCVNPGCDTGSACTGGVLPDSIGRGERDVLDREPHAGRVDLQSRLRQGRDNLRCAAAEAPAVQAIKTAVDAEAVVGGVERHALVIFALADVDTRTSGRTGLVNRLGDFRDWVRFGADCHLLPTRGDEHAQRLNELTRLVSGTAQKIAGPRIRRVGPRMGGIGARVEDKGVTLCCRLRTRGVRRAGSGTAALEAR
jgi:hypothetical protein